MKYPILVFVLLATSTFVQAGEEERIVIHHIDPRMVAHTTDTLIDSDIIASRTLTKTEAAKLLKLLKPELKNLRPPYCHLPAYVVQRFEGDKVVATISLCGLCKTWQNHEGKKGYLGLGGTKSIVYLKTLLPLAEVFESVETESDFAVLLRDKKTPFYALELPEGPPKNPDTKPLRSGEKEKVTERKGRKKRNRQNGP